MAGLTALVNQKIIEIITQDEITELKKFVSDQTETLIRNSLGPYSNEHIGHLGSHRRLVLETKCEESSEIKSYSFFVKTIPFENPEEAAYIIEKNVFEQESIFFSQIVPLMTQDLQIERWAPICYIANCEKIILEDLGLKGYSMREKIFDQVLMKSALSAVARMHAASLLAEEKLGKKIDELYPNSFKEMTFMANVGKSYKWNIAGVNSAIDIANHMGLDSSQISELYKHLMKSLQEKKKGDTNRPKVVCHGDLWSNNMMFDDQQPPSCLLVDYQFIRYASPAQDILLLMCLSATREFRKKFEREMVSFYYSELLRVIRNNNPTMKVFSFEDLMIEIEEERLRAVVSSIIYIPCISLSKKIAPEVYSNPDEYQNYQYGNRTDKVLEVMKRDEIFKKRIEESVLDIVEFGKKWKAS